MKNARAILWPVHRWIGLSLGVLFAIITATGIILTWSDELNLREHRPLSGTGSHALSPATTEAIAKLIESNPGRRVMATLLPPAHAKPQAWQVYLFKPGGGIPNVVADIDPYRGEAVESRIDARSWQRWLLSLHYEFLLGTPGAIVAWIVSAALVLMAVTGIWLYRGIWRDLWRWRAADTWRGRIAWLHRWLGAWSLALSLIWGVTGFIYLWLIVPGRFAPDRVMGAPSDPAVYRKVVDLPGLLAKARAIYPQAEITSFRILAAPRDGSPTIVVRALHRERWFWEKLSTVTLDGRSGQVIRVRAPGEGDARERLQVVLGALHFGSQGSRLQQVLWTAGGFAVLFLPISGYSLWLLRRRRAPA